MRTLVIGDVHGCHLALQQVLDAAHFTRQDQLIFLGDYVDRGPDSKAVVDWILARQQDHDIIALRGNHEVLLMESVADEFTFQRWTLFGGKETLASYGASWSTNWPASIPSTHWNFFKQTRSFHESDTHIFVHGSLDPDLPPSAQSEDVLLWDRCTSLVPHQSGRTVICGHTPQITGLPKRVPGGVCIDTAAVYGGWLTCLHLESGHFWQANLAGQTREGDMSEIHV